MNEYARIGQKYSSTYTCTLRRLVCSARNANSSKYERALFVYLIRDKRAPFEVDRFQDDRICIDGTCSVQKPKKINLKWIENNFYFVRLTWTARYACIISGIRCHCFSNNQFTCSCFTFSKHTDSTSLWIIDDTSFFVPINKWWWRRWMLCNTC